ncbi:DUF262 domain-containing protein [Actinomadura hibisca]|uniref:DUF262 domain-containing protein n=1 Tax=Actinomadura hibisca TaxID=68565 RepID=UPI000A0304D2|nr:DUF262 domain-containing protein [Actinomadura hibisca]
MELLPAESAMFRDREEEERSGSNDEEVNARYARGEVRIVTEQARYPLTAIPGMVESEDYQLNPDFQRRHRWDVIRKSRLIESFIMNVPIPPIFLYEARFSFYEVMDGLQRLTAIRDFYRDQYPLEGLQEWSDLNGRRYSELPEEVRRGVDRRYLSSIILLHETAKTVEEAQRLKQLVFERINSGGERLTAQESRNAVFPGPMNDLCIRLSRNDALRAFWLIPDSAEEDETLPSVETGSMTGNTLFRTMGDVELVLRFFAYRQQLEQQDRTTLRDYLDDYLRRGNLLPSGEIEELGKIFEDTASLVRAVLGDQALYMFKPVRGNWHYTRPTLTVYDPLMWSFSNHLKDAEALLARKQSARQLFEEMFRENLSSFSGRTAEHKDILKRNQLFSKFVGDILSQPEDPEDERQEMIVFGEEDTQEIIDAVVVDELESSNNSSPGEKLA